MSENQILRTFAERLNNLILETLSYQDLERTMQFRLNQRLADIALPNPGFDTVAFQVVLWADRQGLMMKLAEAVGNAVPSRQDVAQLVTEMRQSLSPPAPTGGQGPQVDRVGEGSAAGQLPTDLPALIRAYERIRGTIRASEDRTKMMAATTDEMFALPLEQFDIPDRLHLSESPGERLAAVVALRKKPDRRYLRWLSERLTAEKPFVGYAACLALQAAARQLPPDALDRVALAAKEAVGLMFVDGGDKRDRKRALGEVQAIVLGRNPS